VHNASRPALPCAHRPTCAPPPPPGAGDTTQDSANRLILEPGSYDTYLAAPSAAGMRLGLRPADPSLAIVSVRLLVGVGPRGYVPSEIKVGGRVVAPAAAAGKRWYQVLLSPGEALAPGELTLQVGGWVVGMVVVLKGGVEPVACACCDVCMCATLWEGYGVPSAVAPSSWLHHSGSEEHASM
jgi:hypothetical protein